MAAGRLVASPRRNEPDLVAERVADARRPLPVGGGLRPDGAVLDRRVGRRAHRDRRGRQRRRRGAHPDLRRHRLRSRARVATGEQHQTESPPASACPRPGRHRTRSLASRHPSRARARTASARRERRVGLAGEEERAGDEDGVVRASARSSATAHRRARVVDRMHRAPLAAPPRPDRSGSRPRRPTRVTTTSAARGSRCSSIAGHALSAMTANTSTSRRSPDQARQLGRQRRHPGRIVRAVDHARSGAVPSTASRPGQRTSARPARTAPAVDARTAGAAASGRAARPRHCARWKAPSSADA